MGDASVVTVALLAFLCFAGVVFIGTLAYDWWTIYVAQWRRDRQNARDGGYTRPVRTRR